MSMKATTRALAEIKKFGLQKKYFFKFFFGLYALYMFLYVGHVCGNFLAVAGTKTIKDYMLSGT